MTDTPAYENDLVLRAARGEETPYTPIWLMRQAGRTDPEYNKLKDAAGLPLEDLFRHPVWAGKVTLLPKRLGVDALIVFQDILTPLAPMGAPFKFAPGPMLEHPIDAPNDLDRLQPFDVERHLRFVGETFDYIRNEIGHALPILGFAGAPLTDAAFILEGHSFGNTIENTKIAMTDYPDALHGLLDRLTTVTIESLRYQIACGAAAVQLFESAAYLLNEAEYQAFALPYQQRIFEALGHDVPTIVFARAWPHIADLGAAGASIVSLPGEISIGQARAELGRDRVVQGNLDNELLAYGGWDAIETAARACVEVGEHRGHIFNLSHGLLRDTPFATIQRLVQTVQAIRAK